MHGASEVRKISAIQVLVGSMEYVKKKKKVVMTPNKSWHRR